MTVPVVAQGGPYTVSVEQGETYYWCTCGLSAKQPFCDGAHKGTGMKSLAWECKESGTVAFCGCKTTKNGPFCDGAHATLSPSNPIRNFLIVCGFLSMLFAPAQASVTDMFSENADMIDGPCKECLDNMDDFHQEQLRETIAASPLSRPEIAKRVTSCIQKFQKSTDEFWLHYTMQKILKSKHADTEERIVLCQTLFPEIVAKDWGGCELCWIIEVVLESERPRNEIAAVINACKPFIAPLNGALQAPVLKDALACGRQISEIAEVLNAGKYLLGEDGTRHAKDCYTKQYMMQAILTSLRPAADIQQVGQVCASLDEQYRSGLHNDQLIKAALKSSRPFSKMEAVKNATQALCDAKMGSHRDSVIVSILRLSDDQLATLVNAYSEEPFLFVTRRASELLSAAPRPAQATHAQPQTSNH